MSLIKLNLQIVFEKLYAIFFFQIYSIYYYTSEKELLLY
jgi:hypothetical protein